MSKNIVYKTHGTCSQFIDLTVDDNNVITNVQVIGGCNGNLKGISSLVTGMHVDDVKRKLAGITCGTKNTSCPDQLVRAIEALEQKQASQ